MIYDVFPDVRLCVFMFWYLPVVPFMSFLLHDSLDSDQLRLEGVRHVYSTRGGAFAAVKEDHFDRLFPL